MPHVVTTTNFKKHIKTHLKDLFDGKEDFVFVANETSQHKSFIVTTPQYFANLMNSTGKTAIYHTIEYLILQVKERVSDKYSRIRKGQ